MFHKKLYLDFLRQTKLAGLIFSIISLLISLLVPVICWFEQLRIPTAMRYTLDLPIYAVTPVLFVMTFVAVPMFVFSAFHFLTKRNACDYYHSLPVSRLCLFGSIVAAVITWIVIMVVPTVLLTGLAYTVFGLGFNWAYVMPLIGSFLSAMLLVAGGCTIAVSITGTLFSNIVVSALFVFLPRVLVLFVTTSIAHLVEVLPSSNFGLLDARYHLPIGFLASVFGLGNSSFETILTFGGGMLYTVVLALVYLAIAMQLFAVRKSETADKSAPNKWLHVVYRCLLTIPTMLPITYVFAQNLGDEVFDNDFPMCLTLVIISLIIYFVYELIATRKLKNILKAAPMFLIVVALSVGLGISMHIATRVILSRTPSPDAVKTVRIVNDLFGDERYQYDQTKPYRLSFTEEIAISDAETIKILANGLDEFVEYVKDEDRYFYRDNQATQSVTVEFLLQDGEVLRRKFALSNANFIKLYQALWKQDLFVAAARRLPDDNEIRSIDCNEFSPVECKKLWEILKAELTTMRDEEYMRLSNLTHGIYSDIESFATVQLTIAKGANIYGATYRITDETPKTLEYFMGLTNNREHQLVEEVIDRISIYTTQVLLEQQPTQKEFSFSASVSWYPVGQQGRTNANYGIYFDPSGSTAGLEEYDKALQIVAGLIGKSVDITQTSYARIYVDCNYPNANGDYVYTQGSLYVPLSAQEFDRIIDLMQQGDTQKKTTETKEGVQVYEYVDDLTSI